MKTPDDKEVFFQGETTHFLLVGTCAFSASGTCCGRALYIFCFQDNLSVLKTFRLNTSVLISIKVRLTGTLTTCHP